MMTPPTIATETLQAHVTMLAGTIGEHNVFKNGTLARAADYIEQVWRTQGWEVTRYPYNPYDFGHEQVCNLEITRRGVTQPDKIVVVGAHYDSAESSPGANDNGSGVAALLSFRVSSQTEIRRARSASSRSSTKNRRFSRPTRWAAASMRSSRVNGATTSAR
jgi:hypothetical protein